MARASNITQRPSPLTPPPTNSTSPKPKPKSSHTWKGASSSATTPPAGRPSPNGTPSPAANRPRTSAPASSPPSPGLAIDPVPAAAPVYVAGGKEGTGHEPDVTVFSLQTVPDVTTTRPARPHRDDRHPHRHRRPLRHRTEPRHRRLPLRMGRSGLTARATNTPKPPATGPPPKSAKAASRSKSKPTITGLASRHVLPLPPRRLQPQRRKPSVHQPSLGADLAFGPPLIEAASALSVSSTAAELQAEVDPRGLDTHVRIEYVTQAHSKKRLLRPLSTEEPTSAPPAPRQAATFQLTGLAPATAYRYRAVAENALAEGPEAVDRPRARLHHPGPRPFALPDPRLGARLPARQARRRDRARSAKPASIQAAAAGDAITYLATAPTEADRRRLRRQAQVLSARGPSGWSTARHRHPPRQPTGSSVGNQGTEYQLLLPRPLPRRRAARRRLRPPSPPKPPNRPPSCAPISSPASRPPSARAPATARWSPRSRRLRRTSPKHHFGEAKAHCPRRELLRPRLRGRQRRPRPRRPRQRRSPQDGRRSRPHRRPRRPRRPLSSGPPAALAQVSVLPDGHPAPVERRARRKRAAARGAISADGSRIVWTLHQQAQSKPLPARHGARPKGPSSSTPANRAAPNARAATAVFQLAIRRRLPRLLHRHSTASPPTPAPNPRQGRPLRMRRRRIRSRRPRMPPHRPHPQAGGESAEVQGAVLGASERRLLPLLRRQRRPRRQHRRQRAPSTKPPSPGRPNLYLRHEGRTTFIAALSGADSPDWTLSLASLDRPRLPRRPLAGLHVRSAPSPAMTTATLATGRPDAGGLPLPRRRRPGGRATSSAPPATPPAPAPTGVEYEQLELRQRRPRGASSTSSRRPPGSPPTSPPGPPTAA